MTVQCLFLLNSCSPKPSSTSHEKNSPPRDVGCMVQLQEQHRTTHFPACVRKLKHSVKPKRFLITSCRIAVSPPFFSLGTMILLFFFFGLTSNRFQDVLVFCGNLSSDCLREAICQLESQAPCPFPTWALSHAEESVPFSSEFFGKTVSTLLGRQVGFVTFVPVGKSSGPLQAAALLCRLA